jgi:hypothetical protein
MIAQQTAFRDAGMAAGTERDGTRPAPLPPERLPANSRAANLRVSPSMAHCRP